MTALESNRRNGAVRFALLLRTVTNSNDFFQCAVVGKELHIDGCLTIAWNFQEILFSKQSGHCYYRLLPEAYTFPSESVVVPVCVPLSTTPGKPFRRYPSRFTNTDSEADPV